MSKKWKIILFSAMAIGLIGFVAYNYIMFGGARNLSTEKTDFTVSSAAIMDEFRGDIESANKKYLEKAVAITGTVSNANRTEVVIDNTIICSLKNEDSSVKKGQTVTVKGRLVGFDDLMGELKLDQCFIIKN